MNSLCQLRERSTWRGAHPCFTLNAQRHPHFPARAASTERRRHRHWLPLFVLLLASGCTTLGPPPPLQSLQGLAVLDTDGHAGRALHRYQAATDYKAVALAWDSNGALALGASAAQPNELAAVRAALASCEQRRGDQGVAAPCEVYRLGAEEFELGRALRRRAGADEPTTPTLLWRFRHGEAVLYVAGSMHAQPPTALPLAPALDAAYRDAQRLLVELDLRTLDATETQRIAREHSLLPAGTTLDSLLTADRLTRLRGAADRLGVPWRTLSLLRVGSALSMLAVNAIQSAGFDTALGVDSLLLARARIDGKEIQPLERYAEQVALLADAPLDGDAGALDRELNPAVMRASVQRLFAAWLRADGVAVLQAFGGRAPAAKEAWTTRLLDDRNRRMADAAMAELQSGRGTTLLLVGTAHLPGPNGIVALLEQAGFVGEQLSRGGAPHRALPVPARDESSAVTPAISDGTPNGTPDEVSTESPTGSAASSPAG